MSGYGSQGASKTLGKGSIPLVRANILSSEISFVSLYSTDQFRRTIIKSKTHMRSKIQIDLAEDNQPIINIEYYSSDDVRDKMVKRFLETFAGSDTAYFQFNNHDPEYVNSSALIRPLSRYQKEIIEDLKFAEGVIEAYNNLNSNDYNQVSLWFTGDSLGVSNSNSNSTPFSRDIFRTKLPHARATILLTKIRELKDDKKAEKLVKE